jgi:putative flippase GtrA
MFSKLLNREVSLQFLVYAGVGAIGTLGHYAVLIFLVQAVQTRPFVASTFGFIVGGIINYVLNYKITFKSSKNHHQAFLQFFTVALFGLVLNSGVMWLGTEQFHVHYLIVQLLATFLVLVVNFLINKFWTFAQPS